MNEYDVDDEYAERTQIRSAALTSKSRMPKMPDLSGEQGQPDRPSPFILDDFKGSWAYRVQKP